MLWAVLDSNTLVSGLGWGGTPGRVVDHALAGRFLNVTTEVLLIASRSPKKSGFPQIAESVIMGFRPEEAARRGAPRGRQGSERVTGPS